ncbi:hypothetical protein PLANPX_0795 [Lacipirellula parvula]|uniref:Uncharacterized protein n=1 Tax=Lacipirellula parvula TaxID=2650471 RepID=A0A5K7X9S9_9BACT|nr:hypothetical protein PLANPX_0795 [Lacipirellula parvula]
MVASRDAAWKRDRQALKRATRLATVESDNFSARMMIRSSLCRNRISRK